VHSGASCRKQVVGHEPLQVEQKRRQIPPNTLLCAGGREVFMS
jgi:hypothetical protein